MTVAVGGCQTTPTILPSQAVPNPRSLVEVAFGIALLCYRHTSLIRPPPRLSKSPDLRLVLEKWKMNHDPSSKGEVTENDGGDHDHHTSYVHPQIPTDEDRRHGSRRKDAWSYPTRRT